MAFDSFVEHLMGFVRYNTRVGRARVEYTTRVVAGALISCPSHRPRHHQHLEIVNQFPTFYWPPDIACIQGGRGGHTEKE